MKTKIQKWGNSLGVRLPKNIVEQTDITSGTPVLLTQNEGCIVIEPVQQKEDSINDLLAAITEDNIHEETEWGNAQGKEVW